MSEAPTASHKRTTLAEYLHEQVDAGSTYFKSRHIGNDLGMTPKEVGTNLGILSRESDALSIEQWAQSSKATTWLIQKPAAIEQ